MGLRYIMKFLPTGSTLKDIQIVEFLDSMFQKNMENVSLSIKEEIADKSKYGSSNLHPDTGVLEEDSSKVNVRLVRSTFRFFFFIVSFVTSQSSFRLVKCPARCL